MPRRIRDSALDTRTTRLKLTPQREPYWHGIERGMHLGYRRLSSGPGSWIVRTYDHGGYKFMRLAVADDHNNADGVSVMTFWQAADAARKAGTKASADGFVSIENARLTVADCMAAYLAHLEIEGRSSHSIRDTRCRIDAFVLPKLGSLKTASLTAEGLIRWRNDLVHQAPRLRSSKNGKQKHRAVHGDDAKRARRSSANRCWSILRAGLNHAFGLGKIPSDRAWRAVKSFEDVDGVRSRHLTIAEAKRLLNACPTDFRLLVQSALQTGSRLGELVALTVSDFNSDVGTLAIRKSKSGKARHVTLSNEGISFFTELTAGRAGDEPMLLRSNGTSWENANVRRPLLEAIERAKIKPGISFHGLRHSWASLSIMAGMPMLVVAKNLGHTDGRMCEKHYAHLTNDYVSKEIRKHAPEFGFKASGKVRTLR
jgi:integrase